MISGIVFDKWVGPLLLGIGTILGTYFFGEAYYFDIVFIAALAVATFLLRRNTDVFSALTILLFLQLVTEVLFNLSDNTIAWKVISYLAFLYCVLKFKTEDFRLVFVAILAMTFLAEVYRFITEDKGIDHVYWHVLLFSIYMAARYNILIRPTVFQKYSEKRLRPTFLDFHLYRLMLGLIAIEGLAILDYVAHAVTPYSSSIIYHTYPYAIQLTKSFIAWYSISFAYKAFKTQSISA